MSEDILGKFKLVLGLEIHLHVKTEKKMFCRCSTDIYKKEPNTHTCPTCLGLPGALPVPNKEAIRKTHLLGKALNSEINRNSRFDRKHYFYPDLPKGYQISQYKQPLCVGGHIDLEDGFRAENERVHLEEDTAKSMHEGSKTLIDFNMSSMPLVEIVTKPVFTSVAHAVEFSKRVQKIVQDYKLGDANMEKGQMRLEPNISLRTEEMELAGELPPYKVEIKNINSFKFMEKAVKAEIKRQKELLEKGDSPIQENRGYDEATGKTVSQRTKEHAHDYRYFPEPDIPPLVFDEAYLQDIENEFADRVEKVPSRIISITLTEKLKISDDALVKKATDILSKKDVEKIAKLVEMGHPNKVVLNIFINKKEVRGMSVEEIDTLLKDAQDKVSDESELVEIAKKVLENNQDAVEKYKNGKTSVLQFLVGMMMKETKGKADAPTARELLLKLIEK